MKPFRRFGVELKQRPARLVLTIVIAARAALFDHRNSRARRQFPHRRWKIEMLVIHDETENAPPTPQPKQ